ncbi:ribonuclease H family protein [Pseudomonas guineae]|uniref:ribonuclease H family protein n=1 Tax=Pseudomonas guineae TaxID=425504 RepID=UPI003CFBF7C9
MTTNTYIAYVDGACINNGKSNARAGWGALIHSPKGATLEIAGPLEGERQTNQRAELTAAIMALKATPQPAKFDLYSDSQYVVKGINEWMKDWKARGWKTASKKPVENLDLWLEVEALLVFHQVTVSWVKGHSGHPGNDKADALAENAAMFQKPHRLLTSESPVVAA